MGREHGGCCDVAGRRTLFVLPRLCRSSHPRARPAPPLPRFGQGQGDGSFGYGPGAVNVPMLMPNTMVPLVPVQLPNGQVREEGIVQLVDERLPPVSTAMRSFLTPLPARCPTGGLHGAARRDGRHAGHGRRRHDDAGLRRTGSGAVAKPARPERPSTGLWAAAPAVLGLRGRQTDGNAGLVRGRFACCEPRRVWSAAMFVIF